MNDECLICGAPLEYLETDEPVVCSICHKPGRSKTRCIKGHYVCDECHTAGLDTVLSLCLTETSADPVVILEKLMDQPSCHMHGPEHHVLVGASLLTAYRNAGGDLDLEKALTEIFRRGKDVPGGSCGFWGACGAGISSGMFVSILTGATPLSKEPWGLSNSMTAASLAKIGSIGGPRCCKRNSYTAILTAADFVKEHFDITMDTHKVVCRRSAENNQCIGKRCPYSAARSSDSL